MNTESFTEAPSSGFAAEATAFFEAIDDTSPDSLSACAGWTAHEISAHIAAAATELARNLEAYGEHRPVPATRGFEEREAPYRSLADEELRMELPRSITRAAKALDAVLVAEPGAVVPWTGRHMVVKTFVTHLRSEFALHRWDLLGDDETSWRLLAQPELTDHAVEVLGRVLVSRGMKAVPAGFRAVIASPGSSDVVALADEDGARLTRGGEPAEPSIVGDAGARLLMLWGRRPNDPRRLQATQGAQVLDRLQRFLAGY